MNDGQHQISSPPINHTDLRKQQPSLTHPIPPKDPASRHSPVAPLAPLEYLQNQRRGSITDPSLHAAPPNSHPNSNHNSAFRQPPSSSLSSGASNSHHDKLVSLDPRPTSPYVFGDATPHSTDSQLRKLLRSPSAETDRINSNSTQPRQEMQGLREGNGRNIDRPLAEASGKPTNDVNQMNVDSNEKHEQQPPSNISVDQGRPIRDSQQFDYNMRRHSIAVGHDPHAHSPGLYQSIHGTKRKMSMDRSVFPPVGEEIDPQLVGPGVPSAMVDTEAPAPKRRGSAIDTARIAQMSLNDRRNSVDSRAAGNTQWWINERRDSTPSIFSNPSSVGSSVGGYPSAFSADSPHGRPPPGIATFAWPSSAQSPDHSGLPETDSNIAGPFDPHVPHLRMMPPISFASDRRMSVPDGVAPNNSATPNRVLRSRSRPPSRQLRTSEQSIDHQSGPSSSSNADDPVSAPSPSSSNKAQKEGVTTPYSRSPELRVSHKLAERKRRKEMKDLFDDLRDQLPADRGMKASKWEILSKAIDFIAQLKQGHQDMSREIDMLRHEVDSIRQGPIPPFAPGGPHIVYSQGPVVPGQYPPPPATNVQQHPPAHPHVPTSRPGSSDNAFPPAGGPGPVPSQNGSMGRTEVAPT